MAEGQAYAMLMDKVMVEMELAVATEALKTFRPYVMLMDGGFSRLKGKGGEAWDTFVQEALDYGTIIVGVIVLHEHIAWYQPAGGLIVLLGVAVSQGLVGSLKRKPVLTTEAPATT